MADDRTPKEIEREIEVERAALENSIAALQSRLSPEAMVSEASRFFKDNGSDVARNLGRAAKDNPVALALTGIGLAWLMTGPRDRTYTVEKDRDPADEVASVDYDRHSTAPASGFRRAQSPTERFDDRVRAADRAMRRTYRQDSILESEGGSDMTHSTTSYTNHDHDDDYNDDPGTWGTVKARARIYRARASRTATDLRNSIDEGTHSMSEEARHRVRQARAAAIAAQQHLEETMSEAADRARRTTHDNPLLVGALAFAAGAAVAALLPRTDTEDRAIGAYRDQMFDEADRVFREELSKLKKVAEATVAEGQSALKDAMSETGETMEGAANRVSSAARSEASSQRLGKVS